MSGFGVLGAYGDEAAQEPSVIDLAAMNREQTLAQIRRLEGFAPRATWDYAQHSNGFGTRATAPGEPIDRATADKRLNAEYDKAASYVDKFIDPSKIDSATRAALISLTYNAGPKWQSEQLGRAVQAGDMARARELFTAYNRAGGARNDGLVARRNDEINWPGAFGNTRAEPLLPGHDINSKPVAFSALGSPDDPTKVAQNDPPKTYTDQDNIYGYGATPTQETKQPLGLPVQMPETPVASADTGSPTTAPIATTDGNLDGKPSGFSAFADAAAAAERMASARDPQKSPFTQIAAAPKPQVDLTKISELLQKTSSPLGVGFGALGLNPQADAPNLQTALTSYLRG